MGTMALDPQAQGILDKTKALGLKPVYLLPVDEARVRMEAAFRNPYPPEVLESVEDVNMPAPVRDLKLRIYRPSENRGLGCLVFIHGGGWTVNSLDTHDFVCRRLSKGANCVVISVDHRRSPEFKYPAALEDAYAAVQWAFSNGDRLGWNPAKVAVGGDSSGGTLATTAAMLNRDRGGPKIAFQLLIYPVTDYYLPETPSYKERGTGYSVDRAFMIWSWNNYLLPDANLNDPYLCPLRASDLSGMPPTLIATAEYDPLRDEGKEYAKRLEAAGNKVELWHHDDQMHGFILQTRTIDRARKTLEEICNRLRVVLKDK
jgi:acetyl esterase